MSADEGDNVNHIHLHLPEEIIVEILLRSPIKSLLRFRSVCKTWHALIDSPPFINRHTTVVNTTAATKNHRLHLIRYFDAVTDPTISATLLSDSVIIELEGTPSCLEDREEMRLREDEDYFFTHMWGPLNGVYCMMVRPLWTGFGTLILWNPGNRQFHVLPQIPRPSFIYSFPFDELDHHENEPYPVPIVRHENNEIQPVYMEERENHFVWGYGFDPSSNDYKIIGIGNFGDWFSCSVAHFTWFHIYSLSTNTWKLLDPFDITAHHPSLIELSRHHDVHDGHGRRRVIFMPSLIAGHGVYLDGACHWLWREWTGDGIESWRILSFDLGPEVFRIVSRIPKSFLGKLIIHDVSIVDGCLAMVVAIKHDEMFDVCVMKEYGVDESWMRAYRISLNPRVVKGTFRGIVDDEFFVRKDDGRVVSYRLGSALDSDEEPYEYCWVPNDYFSILPYRPSLIPVKPRMKLGQ